MRVAAIDIGTNTVLLLVAESQGGALRPIVERAAFTRLGEGVDRNRSLSTEASERTLTCLAAYADEFRRQGAARVGAVGTSALRDVNGAQSFLARAAHVLGVPVRVIDGEEEARLTFAGALTGLPPCSNVTVFDVGGGSTEIVAGSSLPGERRIASAVSLNVGSVRLFERHVHHDPPTEAELNALERDLALALASAPPFEAGSRLVGVAGTITQLAALEHELERYDGARVHGTSLSALAVERLAKRLAAQKLTERRALPGMEPARADVIVAGSAIVYAVLRWAGASELIVSDGGVRWGLAEELSAGADDA